MLTFLIIDLESYRKYLILRINIYPLSRRILSQRTFYRDESKAIQMPPRLAWQQWEPTQVWPRVHVLARPTDSMRAVCAHQLSHPLRRSCHFPSAPHLPEVQEVQSESAGRTASISQTESLALGTQYLQQVGSLHIGHFGVIYKIIMVSKNI